MCGVPLLGKSLGRKELWITSGIDRDQSLLQREQGRIGVALEVERHDMVRALSDEFN
jgi:hypothetical protein